MVKRMAGLSVALAVTMAGGLGYMAYTGNMITVGKVTTSVPAISSSTAIIDSDEVAPPRNTIPSQRIVLPQATRITGTAVAISADSGIGCGAVISENIVLTVAHVIGDQKIVLVDIGRYSRVWVPARVVGTLGATGEGIKVLQLLGSAKFDNVVNFSVGTGVGIPRWVVTPRGVYDFNPGAVVPGDSGGAILNTDGELIGLVTGYMRENRANVVTLFE